MTVGLFSACEVFTGNTWKCIAKWLKAEDEEINTGNNIYMYTYI